MHTRLLSRLSYRIFYTLFWTIYFCECLFEPYWTIFPSKWLIDVLTFCQIKRMKFLLSVSPVRILWLLSLILRRKPIHFVKEFGWWVLYFLLLFLTKRALKAMCWDFRRKRIHDRNWIDKTKWKRSPQIMGNCLGCYHLSACCYIFRSFTLILFWK